MPPKSNVPIRICGSKTRSGCKTCKQRHVKCDEQKPTCSRCRKANRLCLYENQQRLPVVPGSTELNIGISSFGSRAPTEIYAVRHFGAHLGTELAGGFSNEIWCETIPRVAQHEPSIWYAMTAVGLLDQNIRSGTVKETNASITQYGKAIRELNLRLTSGASTCRQDVILLSCLLLAIYECLQTNLYGALRHIGGGMKLLIEWENETHSQPSNPTSAYLDRKSLWPIFLSLDSQAIQMGATTFRGRDVAPLIDQCLPRYTEFATTEDAHLALSGIFNQMSYWTIWMDPHDNSDGAPSQDWMEAQKHSIETQLINWDQAFEHFIRLNASDPSVYLLIAQRKALHAMFNKQVDGPSEMEWDKYMSIFSEAVENAETYILLTVKDYQPYLADLEDEIGHPDPARSRFTVSMDIVLTLFLISTRCRDAHLRRRALKMLRFCHCKEGIWDSYLCSLLVEKLIELEEKAALANGFIPENARIFEMDVRLGEEKVTAITFKRFVRDDQGVYQKEVVEVLAW